MARFEMTDEARKILDFLLTTPQRFTYEEIQNLTGVNELSRLRGYLMTALRRLRKQGIWYASQRGLGYRLLDEDGKNPIQSDGLVRVRRKAKRLSKDQDFIRVEALTREGKMEYTFNSARIGRLMEATGRKMQNEIKQEMTKPNQPPKAKK